MVSKRDAQIIGQWLQSQASPHTRDCYRRDADRLLSHVRKPLTRIGLGELQSFVQALAVAGLAPVSRARTVAAVKSLFGFCQRMRYTATNPAAELSFPHYEQRLAEKILSEGDVHRVLDSAVPARDRMLMNLLYFGGLRVSEACNLRWRNLQIRPDTFQLTVFGKGGRTRCIKLSSAMVAEVAVLRGHSTAEDPVFRSRTGMPLDRGRVRTI